MVNTYRVISVGMWERGEGAAMPLCPSETGVPGGDTWSARLVNAQARGSSSVDREKSAISVLNKLVEGSSLQLDGLLRDAVTDEMCETGRWASLSRLIQEQNGNLPSQ